MTREHFPPIPLPPKPPGRRPGPGLRVRAAFTIYEMLIAFTLTGAVMTVVTTAARRSYDLMQRTAAQRVALIEVSNLLERVRADEQFAPPVGETKTLPLPPEIASRFRDGTLTLQTVAVDATVGGDAKVEGDATVGGGEERTDANAETESVSGRRITATFQWQEPNRPQPQRLQLSAFRFNGASAAAAPAEPADEEPAAGEPAGGEPERGNPGQQEGNS